MSAATQTVDPDDFCNKIGQEQTLPNELLLRRTKWRNPASGTRNHFDRGTPRHSEHVWNRTMRQRSDIDSLICAVTVITR